MTLITPCDRRGRQHPPTISFSVAATAPPALALVLKMCALVVVAVLTQACPSAAADSVTTSSSNAHFPLGMGLRSALAFSTRTRQLQQHQQQQQPLAFFPSLFQKKRSRSFTDDGFDATCSASTCATTSCNHYCRLNNSQENEEEEEAEVEYGNRAASYPVVVQGTDTMEDVECLHQVTYAHFQQQRQRRTLKSSSSFQTPSRRLLDDDYDDNELECMESLTVPCVSSSSSSSSSSYGKKKKERTSVVMHPTTTSKATRTSSVTATSVTASSSATMFLPTATRGGSAAASAHHHHHHHRRLAFWENMIAGAISRSIAQTIMHPANTLKTMLQTSRNQQMNMVELLKPQYFRRLTRGAGANFLLSVPHGAVNFAVLEFVRRQLATLVETTPALYTRADRIGPTLDFLSSAISTITCSVVSTPQMVVADNIMAGNYQNLLDCCQGLAKNRGIAGFYQGWWPGLVGKIPSYALTWTFFQQLKEYRDKFTGRPATDIENTIMGCIASGTTVCIMIPLDTIKTRLVTQSSAAAVGQVAYKGIVDCAVRVVREEGVQALYRGLAPRVISVMPMIGIQFGVYEFMKKTMLEQQRQRQTTQLLKLTDQEAATTKTTTTKPPLSSSSSSSSRMTTGKPSKTQVDEDDDSDDADTYGTSEVLQEAAMEVAADPEVPFPAPHFNKLIKKNAYYNKKNQNQKETKKILLKP